MKPLNKAMSVIFVLLILTIVPEDLRDRMKQSDLGKTLNIEQKMSLRDRQKAKKRAEDEEERLIME